MGRKIRLWGLVSIAVIVVGAIAAGGAPAGEEKVEDEFRAEANVTVLTSERRSNQVWTARHGEVVCQFVEMSGTQIGQEATVIQLHPTYDLCKIGEVSVTVTTTGCDYIYGSETTTTEHLEGKYAAMRVYCEGENAIKISGPGCTVSIPGSEANEELHGVSYGNEGSGTSRDYIANMELSTIHYETAGAFCFLAGLTTGTFVDGTYSGTMTVEGFGDKCVTNGKGEDIECPFPPGGTVEDPDEYTETGANEGIWVE